jgi:methylenetetrahydrofolate reductase (NADPH)
MFFDNRKFFEFVDECRKIGINVPIIPGIKPLTTKKQASILPSLFHIDVPAELFDEVEKCKSNEDAYVVGTDWCIQQCKELMDAGVPCLHFYTMGVSDATKRVASAIF